MKIKTIEGGRVAWDGWILSCCVDVEDRARAYGESENVIAKYLRMSGVGEFVFGDFAGLSDFCETAGIEIGRAFEVDFPAALDVFVRFLNCGVLIETEGLAEDVLLSRGVRVEGMYPRLEREGARWCVLRSVGREFAIERFYLQFSGLRVNVEREPLAGGRGA
ncbi:hypothetical protein [Corallococcus exiguus]|uniref:hypothetical protein n=1 Tax=Corallococcus exiguus TaxID=83462 RepID=UPI0014722741|nr:hypothetical protein [Corallococcus exiguus]NNB87245.1 hypothetical protein [Corallococcus exiguus]